MKELIKSAVEILDGNPNSFLSGSLALNIQGMKTRREPHDIDIYLPFGSRINDNFFKYQQGHNSNEWYEGENYTRNSYLYKGIEVDFFIPNTKYFNLSVLEINEVRLVNFLDIIKLKISHAYGDSHSKYKHKDDIIFMMSLIS